VDVSRDDFLTARSERQIEAARHIRTAIQAYVALQLRQVVGERGGNGAGAGMAEGLLGMLPR
jgi:hypothetical protein